MGYSSVIVSSAAVVLCLFVAGSNGDGHHHELCLDKMVNFTQIEYVALGECVKEYAPAPKLAAGVTESPEAIKERITKAKENKCMEACFMNHKKMFENGKFNLENSKKFIDEFPSEVRAELTKSLEKCAESIKGKTLTMKNNCQEYEAFIKCVDDDENKICKRKD